jgi:GT2 family glycosyltransferase
MSQIAFSVVSHGHDLELGELLADLARLPLPGAEVLVTLNTPTCAAPRSGSWPFDLTCIRNRRPLGFGANHNQAFARSRAPWFCIINPDVRFIDDPFATLLGFFDDPSIALVAPRLCSKARVIQDSARRFPTVWEIAAKAVLRQGSRVMNGPGRAVFPDWVAGAFMLVRRDAFVRVGGFDEGFRLYYEDVDLCARLHLAGYRVALANEALVIHDGHRASHRDLGHLRSHLYSFARYCLHYPRLALGIGVAPAPARAPS